MSVGTQSFGNLFREFLSPLSKRKIGIFIMETSNQQKAKVKEKEK